MRLYDLFMSGLAGEMLTKPEVDPVTERGALQEAQLVEARLDVSTGRLGLLFDLRQSLQLRTGNTGLLVFQGVSAFSWVGARRPTPRTAWTVVDSTADRSVAEFRFRLYLVPDGEVQISSARASFFAGDVPGLPEAPPNFLEDSDAAIAAAMPSMQSMFDPKHATGAGP
jgi:hypothetical protein